MNCRHWILCWLFVIPTAAVSWAAESSNVGSLQLTLPGQFYAVPGIEMNVYFDNVVLTKTPQAYRFEVKCDVGQTEKRRWTFTPKAADVGAHKFSLQVIAADGKQLAKASTKLLVIPSNAGARRQVRLLIVGDSLTHATLYPNEIARLLSPPSNPRWKMLGTHSPKSAARGVAHEGYGGWTWQRFAAHYEPKPDGTYRKRSSPFVYKSKGDKPKLDVLRYLKEKCGNQKPDYVIFMLGINDCFSAPPGNPNARIDVMFQQADVLLSAFRRAAPQAQIGICLTTPPNSREVAFQANYKGRYPRWGWKRIQHRLVQRQLARFANGVRAGVTVIPTQLNLDPIDGYPTNNGVHPNSRGYKQVGASIYAWLKARLDATANRPTVQQTMHWDNIKPNFSPPKKWRGKFGKYRSPLKFADGKDVKTADDWKRRRAEISFKWQRLLGKWPALITKPKLEILASKRREDFIQHRVRFAWAPNEKTDGYLLIPPGKGPHAAVVTVFYEPETAIGKGNPNRDFALQLARRGFVTLSIGTTKASRAGTYSLYYPSIKNATVEPLSMLGCAAANAWYVLASRPEVDSRRIGIVGHSFGGKWAMFASCLFDKYACAAWSDPGIVFDDARPNVNYWEPWYLGYHPKPWRKSGLISKDNPARGSYPRLTAAGHDLHELHALMAPRPFLVSGGSEDPPRRWAALNHSIEVNRILGYKNRVAMTNRRKHSPNDKSNQVIYSFFQHFLRPPAKKQ